MSKKPYIKIVYPDASSVAMLLTEAMIRRTSGKRVVETTSTDKCEDESGTLFSGVDACKTETSVELTLNLIPAAMDYALTQLIAQNLTKEERENILKNADAVDLLAILGPLAEIRDVKKDPSWEDVEAEARTIGRRKTDKSDKTNEADGKIDAGLLNDIDTEGEDHG